MIYRVSDRTSWDKPFIETTYIAANLGINEGRRLVDAEWPAGDDAGSEAGREIGEEFAAVVVHAPAGADDDLVVEHFGTPRRADAGAKAPLPACECGITDAFAGEVLVVACDNQAIIDDGVGSLVVVVHRGIEIVEAAVLLLETAMVVEANARREA